MLLMPIEAGTIMHVVHPVCRGLEGHPTQRSACLRRGSEDGTIHTAWRDLGPPYDQLLALRTGLAEQYCPRVVRESTGGDWNPLYPGLGQTLAGVGAHARLVRQQPGTKTDQADAAWLAELFAHGLVEPRVIPPPAVPALRALTRTRGALVQTRTPGQNRLSTVWEGPNIKVTHALSDLLGTRGRRMRQALGAGERTPHQLAAWALGTLRRKVPERAWAWTGQCPAPPGRLIQGERELRARLERPIADLAEQRRQAPEPFAPQRAQLPSIPGSKALTARDSLAEMGAERRRLGAASGWAAWAGGSPGTNERAGTRRKGRTGKGNRYLRRVLVPWAWAARKTPPCSGRTLRHWERRRGRKKAAMAVAHKILVILYHVLRDGTCYDASRSERHEASEEEREKKRALAALERLGYPVTLAPVA